jgi:hypothetical protein
MKRAVKIFMSVMSILLLCGAAKPESGILHLVNDTIDLGDVPRDSVAAAPLLVTNTGTAPFVITSVRTNCSCSVGSYPHSEIMPGDTAEIIIKFSARDRRPGRVHKYIYIRSTSSVPRSVAFLKANVK